MPHFGEILALVGTLRTDGTVERVGNSLITIQFPYLLMETGSRIVLENGTGDLILES